MKREEIWSNIEKLSELRSEYSCFDEKEEPFYHALSLGIKCIKALEQEPCENNRLYIKVYADLEPQEKAEKLYQICEEDELKEVYKELGEYCDIEPCDDVVSRQAVLKIIDGWYEQNRDIENIDDLIVLITYMDSVRPQEQTGQFAEWVAREIFDDMWEYNKDAFAEIACRKLAKLGIVRAKGDVWELVKPQERGE